VSHLRRCDSSERDEAISLTSRPPFTSMKSSGTHGASTPGRRVAGRIRRIEKSSGLVGNRNHHLPACSIATESTAMSRAPPPPLSGLLADQIKDKCSVLMDGRLSQRPVRKVLSSRTSRCAVSYKFANAAEEPTASILNISEVVTGVNV
jgi:hypothetical protein